MPLPGEVTKNDAEEYEFRYPEDDRDQPSTAIVEAVAWVKNTEIEDLRPVSSAVDPDALNEILDPMDGDDFYRSSSKEKPSSALIRFVYEGTIVSLKPGRFTIKPI